MRVSTQPPRFRLSLRPCRAALASLVASFSLEFPADAHNCWSRHPHFIRLYSLGLELSVCWVSSRAVSFAEEVLTVCSCAMVRRPIGPVRDYHGICHPSHAYYTTSGCISHQAISWSMDGILSADANGRRSTTGALRLHLHSKRTTPMDAHRNHIHRCNRVSIYALDIALSLPHCGRSRR